MNNTDSFFIETLTPHLTLLTQQAVADLCGVAWITVRDWKRKGYLVPRRQRDYDGVDMFALEDLRAILRNAIGSGQAPWLLRMKRRGPAPKPKQTTRLQSQPSQPETAEDYGFELEDGYTA
ncbi:hypothetical protein OpiT1DRAFT_04026 [Opitutaceae bacterium TAV1]|nr:hypothetical protein OpiT1DRAFT_04026 [Opitutaceae bacterium TAV1]